MGLIPQNISQSVEHMQISYIRPYHREIARRLVLGQRASDIARDIGMTASRLSIIINSPLFKIELQRLEDVRDEGVGNIGKTLKELSPVALEVIERTMYQARSEKLKFEAAQDVLNRAGYGAINKSIVNVQQDTSISYNNMTDAELKRLVGERVQRIQQEQKSKDDLQERANSIQLNFDEVPEEEGDVCSNLNPSLSLNVVSV